MRVLILIIASCWTAVATAEIYRSVDESGAVVFTDIPGGKGAETVELQQPSVYSPRTLPSSLSEEAVTKPAEKPTVEYASVTITQPEHDGTIRDNTGHVGVAVELDPPLKPNHSLGVLLDGAMIFDQLKTTQIGLSNVDRGTHTLQVVVLDAEGAEVATSAPVSFHLHRTIARKAVPLAR